jgi:tetratricopeptide (TPR) repeat protein
VDDLGVGVGQWIPALASEALMSDAPVQTSVPAPSLSALARGARFYSRRDLAAGGIAFAVAFAGYLWTLAPSVTLEDSGEFLTAAYHLGVPHPPGYPVWTILAWVWYHIIPFGNIAWRINMMSAFFSALACGLATLLVSKSGQLMCARVGFLHADANRRLVDWIVMSSAICAGLLLAFSPVMWSQAVIAEVYGLNAFCLMLTLAVLYRWSFETEKLWRLYLAAFIWGVGLTAHQTLVLLVIAFPMFVWLADRKFGRDVLVPILIVCLAGLAYQTHRTWDTIGALETARQQALAKGATGLVSTWTTWSLPLLVFAALTIGTGIWLFYLLRDRDWIGPAMSTLGVGALGGILGGLVLRFLENDPRAGWAILAGGVAAAAYLAAAAWLRNRRPDDVKGATRALLLYLAVVLGLSLYAYLFFASCTNPPMNWGHCSEWDGFKHHFTRGQYEKVHLDRTFLHFWGQLNMFFDDLQGQFNIVYALLALLALFFFRDLDRQERDWLKFLLIGFLCLGVGFIFLSNPGFEKQKQFTDRVFFLPGHCIYALWIGYGIMLGLGYLFTEKRLTPTAALPAAIVVLLLPTASFFRNWNDQEERGHDFGYRFGYLMFKPGGGYPEMERDAVLYGGTDPGRFVPTYMIFVESGAPSSAKSRIAKCPDSRTFDRRDVYIITQNALADATYMAYIRDHYDYSRPRADDPGSLTNRSPVFRWLYRWAWDALDRRDAYPKQPIWIPSERDAQLAFRRYVEELKTRPPMPGEEVRIEGSRVIVQGVVGVMKINSYLTKDIFDRNKDKHSFYVEESYVIDWMYPYLEPYGIILKINNEPLPALTPEMVARDRAYWDALVEDLDGDPRFRRDDVAQKTFSKLRSAIGGLYAYRGMTDEAKYAFEQSIRLCPESPEGNFRLTQLYLNLGQYDDAIRVMQNYQRRDPQNNRIRDAINQIKGVQRSVESTRALEQQLQSQPTNVALALQLARVYAGQRQTEKLDSLVNQLLVLPDLSEQDFLQLAGDYAPLNRPDRAASVLTLLVQRFPRSAPGWYNLARARALLGQCDDAVTALERRLAVDDSPQELRARLRQEPLFNPCRTNPRFQRLIEEPVPAAGATGLPFRIMR